MNFHYSLAVHTDADETWGKLQDTLAVVRCIPGVEGIDPVSDSQYNVTVVTKIGPIALKFNGQAELAVDADDRRMEAGVSMSDARSGRVYGKFTMWVRPAAEGAGTTLEILADLAIAGKLGELAQPLIKRKADQIVREFSQNLSAFLQAA